VSRTAPILTLATALAFGAAAVASPSPEPDSPVRPRVALALSGGGARGIAHIGALRALEEAGIPIDAIAANSMGAIVGAIYASGRTAGDLDDVVLSLDWSSLFSGRPDRRTVPVARRQDRHGSIAGVDFDWHQLRLPSGLLSEHRVNRFLIEQLAPAGYAAHDDFDALPIPFRCVATDLESGERVILKDGDLPRAVRASMSIPLAFPPVEWRGRRLVDGLVVDNLPVDVARMFGASVVVAIDIGSPPLEPDEYEDALGVANQVTNLLTNRRNEDYAAEPDVLVRPDLGKHKTTDYSGFDDMIETAYEATKAALPEIRAKLEAAGVTQLGPRYTPVSSGKRLEGTPIAEVVVRGNERLSDQLIRRTFNIPIGPPFDLAKGLRAFDKVDATALLDHAWMGFEEAPSGLRIVLKVDEAPANRAAVGVAYTEWEKARGSVRLSNQNTLGFGEKTELLLVASDAETVGRLSLRGERLFVIGIGYEVSAFLASDKPRYFDEEGNTLNRADFVRNGVDVSLQIGLERWGLLEGGLLIGNVTSNERVGVEVPPGEDQVRALHVRAVADNLDSLLWPRHGRRLVVEGVWNLEGLGAVRPHWRLYGEGRTGIPLGGSLAIQADVMAGLSGRDLPEYDYFRIGGPQLIPGYHHDELKGPQAIAGALSLRWNVVGQLAVFVRGGAGNVFVERADVSLSGLRWGVGGGAVFQSGVGPLALEVGVGDGGHRVTSLSLGWN